MKKNYLFLLGLLACFALSCGTKDDDDTVIPDPGTNVAGSVAGTYAVSTVLSGSAGASTLTGGSMTGSGSVTLTTVTDSTVNYLNKTELTVTATGKKILLNEEIKGCLVRYSKTYQQIYLSQRIGPGTELSVASIILKNRVNVSRKKQEGYDITVDYSR